MTGQQAIDSDVPITEADFEGVHLAKPGAGTGYFDTEEKEILEGDIVEHTRSGQDPPSTLEERRRYICRWDEEVEQYVLADTDGHRHWHLSQDAVDFHGTEIIGALHDMRRDEARKAEDDYQRIHHDS